jgi:hypothetical protein
MAGTAEQRNEFVALSSEFNSIVFKTPTAAGLSRLKTLISAMSKNPYFSNPNLVRQMNDNLKNYEKKYQEKNAVPPKPVLSRVLESVGISATKSAGEAAIESGKTAVAETPNVTKMPETSKTLMYAGALIAGVMLVSAVMKR